MVFSAIEILYTCDPLWERGIFAQKFEIALRILFESGMLAAYIGENCTFVDPSVPALYA